VQDGAYARTALAQLGYAVVILRLFSADFYYIGSVGAVCLALRSGLACCKLTIEVLMGRRLAYTLLALLLLLASAYRHNLVVHFLPTPAPSPTTATPLLCAVAPASAAHDDAGLGVQLGPAAAGPASQAMSRDPSALSATSTTSTARATARRTRQRHMAMASHLFTAGDVVALLSAGMLLVQVALFVLVLRL